MRHHKFLHVPRLTDDPPGRVWRCRACGVTVIKLGDAKPTARELRKGRLGRDCDEELILSILRS